MQNDCNTLVLTSPYCDRSIGEPPSSIDLSATSSESRQAHFRTSSPDPQQVRAMPRTGLSVLLNGGSLLPPQHLSSGSTNGATMSRPSSFVISPRPLSHLTTSSDRYQQDLLDREQQASALAAAGMVAESVAAASGGTVPMQGLQAPPQLATSLPPPMAGATSQSTSSEIDNINWGLMDLGTMNLDDMDMDFAALFDPINEMANMQMEGSGWPTQSSTAPDSLSASPGKPANHQH
jgi:hypothetical protein